MKSKFVIIRTNNAGVHMGTLKTEEPGERGYHVTLNNSRRIWSWSGANSLSELANTGTHNPDKCNISLPVDEIKLLAIEIISVTDNAKENLENVPMWKFKN